MRLSCPCCVRNAYPNKLSKRSICVRYNLELSTFPRNWTVVVPLGAFARTPVETIKVSACLWLCECVCKHLCVCAQFEAVLSYGEQSVNKSLSRRKWTAISRTGYETHRLVLDHGITDRRPVAYATKYTVFPWMLINCCIYACQLRLCTLHRAANDSVTHFHPSTRLIWQLT